MLEAVMLALLLDFLEDFMQKFNVKGKVNAWGKSALIKSRGKLVFRRGKWDWRSEFEERISKDDEIVLLALGDVKYEVLNYLNSRKDLEIVKLETRRLKKREKGLALKAIVRKRPEPKLSL